MNGINPFSVIPVTPNQSVKVWDFMLQSRDGREGRVRVLAVVPKKPNPLINIPVSVAWCAPDDVKKFSKDKANKILVNRFLKAFEFCQTADYSDAKSVPNTGIVDGPLKSLENFGSEAIFSVHGIPFWVETMHLWA